jgi:hypothetical protein
MIENLPVYISIAFILITLLTVWIFYIASSRSKPLLFILLLWLAVQAVVSWSGFYTNTSGLPPRFMLLPGPALIAIIILFVTRSGRRFIDRFNPETLSWLHTIRIAVEIVLLLLFMNKVVPRIMTFEGRNFDILSGLSAPFIAYYGYSKAKLGKTFLIIWNIVCIGLLFNIVITAALSAPFVIQQFGFEQPNIAVLYFPFTWLPCCVVPIVLFSHLTCIRNLLKK